jgi:hypothetical protein
MLININKNQIDNRSEEKIYEDYINKRENFKFLSRLIIIDNGQNNNLYQNYDKDDNRSLKIINYQNYDKDDNRSLKIINYDTSKKKLKKNYKPNVFK